MVVAVKLGHAVMWWRLLSQGTQQRGSGCQVGTHSKVAVAVELAVESRNAATK
jgi:hypothetical protein